MSKEYRVTIEARDPADHRIWQAVHPSELVPAAGSMYRVAQGAASNQNVIDPQTPDDGWRVCVRHPADDRRGLDLYGDGDVVTHHLNGESSGAWR